MYIFVVNKRACIQTPGSFSIFSNVPSPLPCYLHTPLQVTAAMGSGRESTTGVRPALGLAWASLVGTRIMLHRDEVLGNSPDDNLCKVGIPSLIQVSYVTLYLYIYSATNIALPKD